MAESAINFLLEKFVPLLEGEIKLLSGVRREIEDIKYELDSMRAFLKDADARGERDEGVKAWVKQVKDIAYDTEDVLDEFMLRFAPHPHPHGSVCKLLRKAVCLIRRLKARHQIGTQIQDIKTRVQVIKGRSETYHFNRSDQGSSSHTRNNETWHDPRVASMFIEDSAIVGIDKPKNKIISWLLEAKTRLNVVSVVGMGGSGKTTLIKKIYDDERVRLHFECRVWIRVSESYNFEEILRNMLRKVCQAIEEPFPEGIDTRDDILGRLKEKLLKKRYVIVFDDVWSTDLWACIGNVLPDSNCGSRIVVTTRKQDVASFFVGSSRSDQIYNLQPLPSNEAWKLFCKRVFPSNNGEGSCPPELEELSWDILKKCEGLPLAIVVIGGLLSTKEKTLMEWKKLHDGLGSELETNPNLTSLSRILFLSYNDLPYHLKSCFLYLGTIFPQDHLIGHKKLIRLWIAEGFVKEQRGKTLEDVAEDYIGELIHRSLILIGEINSFGKSKSYRVHDLLREIILSKSKEDDFITVLTGKNATCADKIRRLSIHNQDEFFSRHINSSSLRSFFVFGKIELINLPNSSLSSFFYSCRLLRVLDLEGVPLESFPNELASLFHLRFLSLRKTKIRILPKILGKLQNLETLDLRHTFVSKLPIEILKLRRLRHLLFVQYAKGPFYLVLGDVIGMEIPRGIECLKDLQTLSYVDVAGATDFIRELGNLTQLRKFGLVNLRREDGIDLCVAMGKMCNLRFFLVHLNSMDEVIDLDSVSSPPRLLQRLRIRGRLEKCPHWIASLQSLTELSLQWSRLQDNPLTIFQTLPNLEYLHLGNAYEGENLCFEARGFPRLKKLIIDQLEALKSMRVEAGALPNLQKLTMARCRVLENVPLGIEHLVNLKELILLDMPEEFVKKLRKDEEGNDHYRVRHIPIFRHILVENWVVENLSWFRAFNIKFVGGRSCIIQHTTD